MSALMEETSQVRRQYKDILDILFWTNIRRRDLAM